MDDQKSVDPEAEKEETEKVQEEPPSQKDQTKSWKWQLANAITTLEELKKHIALTPEEEVEGQPLSLKITPYYLDLIKKNPLSPIRKTMIPTKHEFVHCDLESDDPLNEEESSPVPGIVHRYPDRVLFLVSDMCSANCRYCTRSRVIGHKHGLHNRKQWNKCLDYIREHEEIRDVLISGGEPLLLSHNDLKFLLTEIRNIKHVEIIRIGTKVPVVLPQRIDKKLCNLLKQFHPLFMSIHFTHPDELTEECKIACRKLADAAIPLGSQTVLLKGINDDLETMKKLFHGLLKMLVKPYYIYSLDCIQGSNHFKVKIEKGLEIMEGLRGHTTGYAIPNFVIDSPLGKIPILPNYVVKQDDQGITLRNYENKECFYPNPKE